MRLIIVRHGQTKWNVDKIMQGQQNNPLDGTGIKQAKKVAERLKGEKIDVIYCSDLKRARMTADEIIRFHPDVPIHCVPELRERGFGEYEGKTVAFVHQKQDESGLDRNEYRTPGGESFRDVSERANAFLDKVRKKHLGQTVLFVTHGGVKRVIMGRLMGLDIKKTRKLNIINTSISIVNFNEKSHKIMVFNCAKHLDDYCIESDY